MYSKQEGQGVKLHFTSELSFCVDPSRSMSDSSLSHRGRTSLTGDIGLSLESSAGFNMIMMTILSLGRGLWKNLHYWLYSSSVCSGGNGNNHLKPKLSVW